MHRLRTLGPLLFIGSYFLMTQPAEAQTFPNLPDVNPELLKLVVADQWDRGMDMFSGRQVKTPESLDTQAIEKRDAERRTALRSMLNAGKIQTGREYEFAAILLQHSPDNDDLQTAHLLASTAVFKGNVGARWLAAASFDRLLWNINRPQVFGTQFKQDARTSVWTMEPYDRQSLSDVTRAAWCVIGHREQEGMLIKLQSGNGHPSTSIEDCK